MTTRWPRKTDTCPYSAIPKRGRNLYTSIVPDCPNCDHYVIDHRGVWTCRPGWREARVRTEH